MAGAHVGLASAHMQLGRIELAQPQLDRAQELNDQIPELHFTWAQLFERRGRLNEAIAAYRRELEISPGHLMSAFNLSLIHRNLQDLEQEERYLQLALTIDPMFPRARLFMARIHLVRGQGYEEASSWSREPWR